MLRLKSLRKILVPLDGTKRSLSGLYSAIYLAKLSGATVRGVNVHFSPYDSRTEFEDFSLNDIENIIKKAENENYDLIILRSKMNLEDKTFKVSSTSRRILNKFKVPVLFMK